MNFSSLVPGFAISIPVAIVFVKNPEKDYRAAKYLLSSTQEIALAAGIGLAASKGWMVAAGLFATLSTPAAFLAGGAWALKYSYIAMKAGFAAKQLTQVGLGALALYAGLRAFNNPFYLFDKNVKGVSLAGILEGSLDKKISIDFLSNKIVDAATSK